MDKTVGMIGLGIMGGAIARNLVERGWTVVACGLEYAYLTPPVGAKLKRREVFLNARHVGVVIRGASEDLIDTWLRSKGIERRIALVVPGYLEALHVAARTDLVAFVPRRLIGALSKQLSLTAITPPLDPGIDEQFMFYPTRAQMDPGSIWLRKLMLETGRELERGTRRAA